jgi:RND family efflux transporter MFP subunit
MTGQAWHGAVTAKRKVLVAALILAAVVLGAAAIYLTQGEKKGGAGVAKETATVVPTVAVVPAKRADLVNTLTLAAEFRPFQEVDVYARVAGYVRQMKVDVGDRVKAGAALAVLDVPELEADLQQASAAVESAEQEVNRAKAAYDEAHLMYSRLTEVLKQQPDLVAQQDIDEARAKDETRKASWVAAQSAVREAAARRAKFRDMIEFSRITAPFAGVVSKRYADTGALMGAGTASASQSLVRLSQLDPLRLILPVPESKVAKIHAGDPVQVFVPSTGQTLSASVARLSGAVATETRTMHVEVDVPNPKLTLAPGMYASATLTLDDRKQALSIPVEAAPEGKEGESTVLVLDKQHKIQERRIRTGIRTPTQVEVTSGLEEGDLVLLGGQGQVQPGQLAEPKLASGGNPK